MSGDKSKNNLVRSFSILFILALATLLSYGFHYPYSMTFSPYQVETEAHINSLKILVAGDMMLDRNVRNLINKIGFEEYFKGVKSLVRSADIAIINLEGPFTPYESLTASLKNKVLKFTFDPALAPALADFGFDVMGLANNHTLNFGKEGLEMTRRYIGTSGMVYYGDPLNKDEISTMVTKNGISIGLVGFHEFNYTNYEKTFAEVARLRPLVDVLLVTPHWGIEYQKEPTDKMVQWAHRFIDNGADAVIGTHTHIVGDIEEYKGKKIFYSLGNFAFDQYFSEATMNGLALIIDVEKSADAVYLKYTEVPIRADRKGTSVAEVIN